MRIKGIALRIRRRYFDQIVQGEKTIEYRRFSDFWRKRLSISLKPPEKRIAVFICGKDVHKREVLKVEHMKTPDSFSDQGKKDVDTSTCFAIHLGRPVE